MRRVIPRLHAVTNDEIVSRPDLLERAAALARPNVALHLRGSGCGVRGLWELTPRFAEVAHRGGAVALVNDRLDFARLLPMDGVHLPERGLPPDIARRLLGDQALVGRSVHSADDARRAADQGVDYVFLGPIWPTTSHPSQAPLGPAALRGLGSIPVIAIGGVTAERVAPCLDAGAHGVAAISALWQAGDPGTAAEVMLISLERG